MIICGHKSGSCDRIIQVQNGRILKSEICSWSMIIFKTSITIDWKGSLPSRDYVCMASSEYSMDYDLIGSTSVLHIMCGCIVIHIMDAK